MENVPRLTWKMLHLDATPPYGRTPAEINKSRRDEKFPIRYDVATLLRKAKAEAKAKADDAVFQPLPTLPMLREDLARAGVSFADSAGNRRIDFHALRKTLIRLCKISGVSMDAASLLLQHRSIATTPEFSVPKLVERCREFAKTLDGITDPIQEWHRVGIGESINLPHDRASAIASAKRGEE